MKPIKKKAEVYFVIYLSLLVSFLAIEDELEEYKERQDRVLFRVAQNETNKLIEIGKTNLPEGQSLWRMEFDLSGYYEEGSLSAEAILIPKDSTSTDTFTFPILYDPEKTTDKYYFETDRGIFKDKQKYAGVLKATIRPLIGDEVMAIWEKSFGDTVVSHELAEKIMEHDELVVTKPFPVIFQMSGTSPVFTVNFAREKVNAIEGTRWEHEIYIGGLSKSDDDVENQYTIKIIDGGHGLKINKKDEKATLSGIGRSNRRIKIEAIRDDDEKAYAEFVLNVRPPLWKKQPPAATQMYLGESLAYNGALEDIEPGDTQISAEGVCVGTAILPVSGELAACDTEGVIILKPIVEGVLIESLAHEISVLPPPPPEITLTGRKGNRLEFTVKVFGRNNGIRRIQRVQGVSGNISDSPTHWEGSILTLETSVDILESGAKPTQRVHFRVIDEYGKRSEHNEDYKKE